MYVFVCVCRITTNMYVSPFPSFHRWNRSPSHRITLGVPMRVEMAWQSQFLSYGIHIVTYELKKTHSHTYTQEATVWHSHYLHFRTCCNIRRGRTPHTHTHRKKKHRITLTNNMNSGCLSLRLRMLALLAGVTIVATTTAKMNTAKGANMPYVGNAYAMLW